jgi:outer membrane protein TolC
MMKPRMTGAVLAVFVVAAAAEAQSPLSLAEALDRADQAAYANRRAQAEADAQSAQRLAPLAGILPTVRVESGWIRTNDPTGSFGTLLRQRGITQADFDPQRLNHPAAIGNYSAAVVVEQPLFNADAHVGRVAATRAAAAADASAEWTRVSTQLDVVRAYYGAVLGAESVATLRIAADAAEAHVRQAESLVKSGVATRSDALLARVKADEIGTQLLAARGDARLAIQELALLLGQPGQRLTVPESLPDVSAVAALLEADLDDTLPARADLRAAEHRLASARSNLTRARSVFLPRVNAFARLDWNSVGRPYAGEENWTAGIMATWTPFAGGSRIAGVRAASAQEAAERAGAEAAEARADLDVERAEVAREVARARLDVAQRATVQSAEVHRIMARKYDGGLATIMELLDAAAIETQSGLSLSKAIHEGIVAEALRRQAHGLDLSALERLETEQSKVER